MARTLIGRRGWWNRSFLATAVLVWACGMPSGAATAASLIQIENAQTGTSGWLVPRPNQAAIAGYADDISYEPGGIVRLFVDSDAAPFTYEIYRMGYYAGAGGRLVAASGGPLPNGHQPAPVVKDDRTNGAKLLLTRWGESTRFPIPADWVSGFYLVKLTRIDSGAQSYAYFVLRSPTPAPIVLVFPTNTWQAYNMWGGLSLYRDHRRPKPGVRRTRARKVSFLRPDRGDHGAGFFFNRERPVVEWLEARGYPVSYATDRDALFGRLIGARTKLVILSGHPEYHSIRERDYYMGLGAKGVSLAIFGGNSFVTQARFSADGDVETVWRDQRLDPVKGPRATLRWELTGWPQSALTGLVDGAGSAGPLRAVGSNHWAWEGAAVGEGRIVGPVQGLEQDGVVANRKTPRKLRVLARAYATRKPHGRPRRIASMTIMPGARGTFVFNGAQNGFPWYFGYPSYPGVIPSAWIPHPKYPTSSQENAAIKRLAGNVIERATGIPNPERARPPRSTAVAPLTFFSPTRNREVPLFRPLVIVWAGAPRGAARVRIAVDERHVATVSARRSTWIGSGLRTGGFHTLRLTAVSRTGRVLATRVQSVRGVSPSHRIFRIPVPWGELWRAWG